MKYYPYIYKRNDLEKEMKICVDITDGRMEIYVGTAWGGVGPASVAKKSTSLSTRVTPNL